MVFNRRRRIIATLFALFCCLTSRCSRFDEFEAATTAFELLLDKPGTQKRQWPFFRFIAYPARFLLLLVLHRLNFFSIVARTVIVVQNSVVFAVLLLRPSSAAAFVVAIKASNVVQHHRYRTSPRRRHHRLLFACQQILTPTARSTHHTVVPLRRRQLRSIGFVFHHLHSDLGCLDAFLGYGGQRVNEEEEDAHLVARCRRVRCASSGVLLLLQQLVLVHVLVLAIFVKDVVVGIHIFCENKSDRF